MARGLSLLALAALLGLSAAAQEDGLEALLKKLGSERQEERDAATRELIRRRRAVRPALERLAKDRDPEVAGRARAIVIYCKPVTEEGMKALQAQLPGRCVSY